MHKGNVLAIGFYLHIKYKDYVLSLLLWYFVEFLYKVLFEIFVFFLL